MTTYLLGAGASADCVPIIKYFRDAVREMLGYIENYFSDSKTFINEFGKFYEEIVKHPTIDIYAKKLLLSGQPEKLTELKKWLSIFFNLRQYFKPPDERYDKFFASIIEIGDKGSLILPDDINIITWNYDLQLEISYSQFLPSGDTISFSNLHNDLNLYPSLPKVNDVVFNRIEGFSITKLNGSAGIFSYEPDKLIPFDIGFGKKCINRSLPEGNLSTEAFNLIQTQINKTDEFELSMGKYGFSDFTYCWENLETAQQSKSRAQRVVKNTENLIIIGYSFPYVNRDVDDSLFRVMKTSLIKGVIIQDPMDIERYNSIERRIRKLTGKSEKDLSIEQIKNTYEFYLPE